MKGTLLFGWCLPGPGETQHAKCISTMTVYDKPYECPCLCHTDIVAWRKTLVPVLKKKEKKK